MMSGFDEQFVAGQSFGFQGGIGTTFNFAPQFYADIYRHYHAGNIQEAARIQADINKVTDLMVRSENWSYRKAIMKYIGLDCGSARAPYAPLSDQELANYFQQLDDLNVLQRNHGARTNSTRS
jgi:N-acetylneuraminate lyase